MQYKRGAREREREKEREREREQGIEIQQMELEFVWINVALKCSEWWAKTRPPGALVDAGRNAVAHPA
jgi:hypothetical protein